MSLCSLATVYDIRGDLPNAEPLYLRSLNIREKVLGPEHVDTAFTLRGLAILYSEKGDNAKAEPLFQRCLQIREKVLGPDHTDTVDALRNLAALYVRTGDYMKAEPLFQRCLQIREKVLGPEHSDTADALDDLALNYGKKGDYTKAEPLFQRCLQIREKVLGPEHIDTAATLNSLAVLYYQKGDFTNAEPLFQRCLQIREKVLGPGHPDTVSTLSGLAALYDKKGDYDKAEPLLQKCLQIQEQVLGMEQPETGLTLNDLAWLYTEKGDYAKAESYYQQSLQVMEKALGAENIKTTIPLNGLAMLYSENGDYDKAKPLFQKCLQIREKALGPEHLDTVSAQVGLAVLYFKMGDYAKAESLLERDLKIQEKVLGPDHPYIAFDLHYLAEIKRYMGDYDKAEPLYQRSLQIREKVFGTEHVDTASTVNSLAILYFQKRDWTKAEPLYLRSLNILGKVLGPEHPYTGCVLNNLADFYCEKGDYAKAESYYQQSLQVMGTALGGKNIQTAFPMDGMGVLYDGMGDYTNAESFFQRSLMIRKNLLSPDHPDITEILNNLAYHNLARKNPVLALQYAREDRMASEHFLGKVLTFTSEQQRAAYQEKQHPYDFLATLGSASDLSEAVLHTKGIVLDSLLEDALVAASSTNLEVQNIVDELRSAGRQLMRLQMETPKNFSPGAVKQRQAEQAELETRVDELQKSLARNVTSAGQTRRALKLTVPEVQGVLEKDTVLLEFIRYNHFLTINTNEVRYGVVLISNPKVAFNGAKPSEPVWVPLGSAATIEQSLKEYRAVMRGEKHGEASMLNKLYTLLFDPIQRRLPKGINTLIISPDAELNFVNIATLLDGQDKFLVEKYTIKYVSSGRDLVFGRKAGKGTRWLSAFANPAFDLKPGLAHTSDTNQLQLAMLATDQRDYDGLNLPPLPGTEKEAVYLREKCAGWKLEGAVYEGAEASEAEVRAVKSPYILHLATHGFFLPDTKLTNRPAMGMRMLDERPLPVVWHNPMQRSGLALAGAQLTLDAWKRGETPNPENDGILMAQEVGTMDLKGTWLVVLSACDTGDGEARAGEGVMGLRRGFVQAGAQNLLMTLWPVSDRWTMEMMEAFYERALKSGDAPGALAEVQREFLVKLKEQKNPVAAARLAGPFILTFQGTEKKPDVQR